MVITKLKIRRTFRPLFHSNIVLKGIYGIISLFVTSYSISFTNSFFYYYEFSKCFTFFK